MRQISQQRLIQITGARTASEQCAVLRQIGVLPLVRSDGSLCVFEEDVMRGQLSPGLPVDVPNWAALDDIRRPVRKRSVLESRYSVLLTSARKRAKAKGMDCTITLDHILEMARSSGERCAVTGISFCATKSKGQHKAPFAPSLDRIDSTKGYTRANTRLVCVCVNMAMNQWGETVLRTIAEAYLRKQGETA